MYTSAGYDLGRGERSDPLQTSGVPQWTPGPGAYNLREDVKEVIQAEPEDSSMMPPSSKAAGWS